MNSRVIELERSGAIDFTRQRSWYDPTTENTKLTVIGGGGIGSFFTFLAAKLGINKIVVYDGDYVEAGNLPNQLFGLDKIGYSKVDAIKDHVENYAISELEGKFERVTADTMLSGIIVSGVDSMAARKEIAQAVHNCRMHIPRYWDARIGGELLTIYCVNPRDPQEWELYCKTLYSDEEAREDPCTMRSIIDVMGHVGSHLLTGVREHLAGKTPDGFVYYNVATRFIHSGPLATAVTE